MLRSTFRRDRWIPVALGLFVLFEVALGFAWLRIDVTPPYWDEASYLYSGLAQLQALRGGGLPAWYHAWLALDRTRPPLVPALTVPLFALFGPSTDTGLLVNLAALIVLLLATYALAARFTQQGSQGAGLLAALLVGSYPVLIGLLHILLVEMVMVALVAAALYALWQSDGFRRTGWALVSGLLIGLGLLTKVYYAVFVAGPWLITVVQGLRYRGGRRELRCLVNALMTLLVSASVAAVWYIPNLATVVGRSISAGAGPEGAPYGPAAPLRWDNVIRYFLRFVGQCTSFPGLLIVVIATLGLSLAFFRSRRAGQGLEPPGWHGLAFLLSSILPPYALFTSLHNQDLKNITGILPATAVLSAWGLMLLLRRRWVLGAVAVAALSVFQVVAGTLPSPSLQHALSVNVLEERLYFFYPAQSHLANTRYARAERTPWPLDRLLLYAELVTGGQAVLGRMPRVGILADAPAFEVGAFAFEAARLGIPVTVSPGYLSDAADTDVFICKSEGWGWLAPVAVIANTMNRLSSPDSGWYLAPQLFLLPDGSRATVYSHTQSPFLMEAPRPASPTRVDFGASARFLGYDSWSTVISSGDRKLSLAYFWESLAATQTDYTVFIHLLDPGTGQIIAQDDHLLFPDLYPTSRWRAGQYLYERRAVSIPATYQRSEIILRLGLYNEQGRLWITSAEPPATQGATYVDFGPVSLLPWPRTFLPLVAR